MFLVGNQCLSGFTVRQQYKTVQDVSLPASRTFQREKQNKPVLGKEFELLTVIFMVLIYYFVTFCPVI